MTAEEADKLLQGFERSPVLDPYAESRGEEMAVGIERASAFLQTSSRGGAAMTRIYTSGGGSRIPGLAEVLAERLGVPVERANPIQNIKADPSVFENLSVDEVVPLLMLPIGLALRAS
jgi:type IV pilus assembly protein PilM